MSGSGISWAICKSVPCSRQITTPAPYHSVLYRPDVLPAAPTNGVKAPTIYHCIAQIHKNTTMLFSSYILTEQTASKHPARKLSVDVTPAILVTFSCSDLPRTRVCLTFKLKLDNRLFITFADLSSRVVSASDCGLREPRFESRR